MAQNRDLMALLKVLSDPENARAKLAEFEAMDARIAKKQAELGLLGDAENILTKTRALRTEAEGLKAQATAEAAAQAQLLSAAYDDLAARQREFESAKQAWEISKANDVRTLQAREKALAEREDVVGRDRLALGARLEETATVKGEYEARLARLLEAARA